MKQVQAVSITTADGESLQAEMVIPDQTGLAVVLTHPHPLMGGDMHTPVPARFFRAAMAEGVAALRFNFRGVGSSTGSHDNGGAERLDVAAAIDEIDAATGGGLPIVLAGWSFGADVSLTIDDARVAGWFLAAPPLSVVDPAEMAAADVNRPKVLAIGSNDQFNPPERAEATIAEWTNTRIEIIDGADHFFGPQLPDLVGIFRSFAASWRAS